MVRRLVIIVVIVAVALGVAMLSRTEEGSGGARGEVLRHDGGPAASPSFEADGASSRPVAPLTDSAAPAGEPAAMHADAPGLRITVLHFDGVPATGSVVVAVPSTGEPWRALTDATGTASGPALPSDCDVWVDGAMPHAWSFPVTTHSGAITLTLPPGEILDGHVLVDGGPPREPFALVVQPIGDGPEESQDIRKLLTRPELGLGAQPWQCGQLIEGDGAFRFSGLRADWSGFFILPVAVVPEAGQDLNLAAPERGVVLRLRRVPRVLLRAMLPSGEPAAQAFVRLKFRTGSDSDEWGDPTDSAGRVSFPMYGWEPTTSFDLEIVDTPANARASLSRPAVDITHDLDLGDVPLEQAWAVAFRAIDPRGAPIAGALGATECGELMQSEPTGADGVGRITAVPVGCAELRVGATRCDIVRVSLPAPPPAEPIDVVLSPCASLDVQVVFADERPRPGLTLHTRSVMPGGQWHGDSGFDYSVRVLGTTRYPWSSHDGTKKAADGTNLLEVGRDYPMPASGLFAVGCLPPGIPIALQLVDRTRHAVWRKDFTPQPGEPALLRIDLADVPGTLDVLVTDAAGAPLEQARVRVFAAEPVDGTQETRVDPLNTDAAGRVHVEELYAPTVVLECAHDGYATSRVTAVLAAGLARVVLNQGRAVTAHFVDEGGRPVPVYEAQVARTDGQPLRQVKHKLDADAAVCADWRFDDLPDVPLTITTYVCGHRFDWPLDPQVPDVHFTLPLMGSLVVRNLRGADGDSRLVAESTLAEKERIFAWPTAEDLQADQVRWPVMLPGRYRVVLEVPDPDPAHEDAPRVPRGSVVVEVRAGEEATAVLP